MWARKLTGWPGCYLPPDTGAESGGEAGGEGSSAEGGQGQQAQAQGQQKQETQEQREARLLGEARAEAAKEVDRYRNEAGQSNRKLKELETKLQKIEDEKKPELERLTEAAGKVPTLEEKLGRYEAAFQSQNEEARKILEKTDKELLALIPAGLPPDQEFVCLRNAVSKAMKDAAEKEKSKGTLPPGGGRNPGGNGNNGPTDAQREQAAKVYQSKF
jgi:DNA repair exonuclease SbcCD ATPase subunit